MSSYVRSGDEFLVNTEATGRQVEPSITGLTNGGFVVSWRSDDTPQDGNGHEIKAQVFDATGAKVGGEFLVNTLAADYLWTHSITALANGGFVVNWSTDDPSQDGSLSAIKAQIFDATGAKVGGEFLVNTQATRWQYSPSVTGLADGGFVVSWWTEDFAQDGSLSAIKAQVFDSTGAKVSGEFLVNTQSISDQREPIITVLANGNFVVSWRTDDAIQDGSGSAIKAQIFDVSGAKVGSEFLVNTQATNHQLYPVISSLNNGGFVVSWRTDDPAQDGSFSAIKAQVFNATGAQVDEEFLVNTLGRFDQWQPAISSLADGGFIVSWQTGDPTQDGSGMAVKAQVFNATGAQVGEEFLVNTLGRFDQWQPAITSLADGGFVVSWQTDDPAQDGSFSAIKAQIFSVSVPDENAAPEITSNGGGDSAQISVAENGRTITAITATDPDFGDALTFAISGGVDAALFAIDAASGALSFVSAPDFEVLGDANGDNIYEVTVAASDGSLSDTQAISVTVTDMPEAVGTSGHDNISATSTLGWVIDGIAGNDTITGNSGNDTIAGGAGSDHIFGMAGNDELTGSSGVDLLDGGQGSDTMTGGSGGDVYIVDDIGDRVIEKFAGGHDIVRSSVSLTLPDNVETLVLTGSDNIGGFGTFWSNLMIGNDGDNSLIGVSGNDTVYGGLGNDTLMGTYCYGEAGDDQISGVNRTNSLSGGSGNDTVHGSVGSDTLAGDDGTDFLLGGEDTDILFGGADNDWLSGDSGADLLDGGLGADTMTGGSGNDRYIVDDAGDVIIEGAPASTDVVIASVSYVLADNVEQLELSGGDAIDGAGNALGNRITGNSGANVLSGLGGRDTVAGGDGDDQLYGGNSNDVLAGDGGADHLFGEAGTDALSGGDGDDTLTGGLGVDTLTGNAGADAFLFDASPTSGNADVVADFSGFASEGDRLVFDKAIFRALGAPGALADSAFGLGAVATTQTQRILYDAATGIVRYDRDGSGAAAANLVATLTGAPALSAADIAVIDSSVARMVSAMAGFTGDAAGSALSQGPSSAASDPLNLLANTGA